MKPFLLVDGAKYPIECIDFVDGTPRMVSVNQEGHRVFYYNSSLSILTKIPKVIDFRNAIIWEGRYDPLYTEIQSLKRALNEVVSK